jgi:lipopolysaccharide/colanic/teichoic acid biosynthesis glycosyltransferase
MDPTDSGADTWYNPLDTEVAHSGDAVDHDHLVPTDAAQFLLLRGGDEPLVVSQPGRRQDAAAEQAHRLLDVTLACAILLLVLPLMIVCAVAARCSGPGPILFRHKRIGRDGREFECFKFRTMCDRAEAAINDLVGNSPESLAEWAANQKLMSDPRVTPVGAILRRYCLDELPQLFNVLAGDMSIVGPRPIVADEVERYGALFSVYCSVRPGLTGLWQVSGRHSLPYRERVMLDAHYARTKCIRLDLLIVVKTIPVVLFGQNQ